AEVLKQLQALYASAPGPQPGGPEAPNAVPTPAQATAPAPPPGEFAGARAKRWVWLSKQGVYGFGYQREDGLWVIDPGSKRPDLPPEAAQASATGAGAGTVSMAGPTTGS